MTALQATVLQQWVACGPSKGLPRTIAPSLKRVLIFLLPAEAGGSIQHSAQGNSQFGRTAQDRSGGAHACPQRNAAYNAVLEWLTVRYRAATRASDMTRHRVEQLTGCRFPHVGAAMRPPWGARLLW